MKNAFKYLIPNNDAMARKISEVAAEVDAVYKALHRRSIDMRDVIAMTKEASLAGEVHMVAALSNAIFARAEEQDKLRFSKFLYSNGQKDMIPLPYAMKIKNEMGKL
jgi:hypothetical protein